MNQPKILVVDDDKEIVGAIKKRLEMEDYEIITAYNGLEAMDVLMEQDVQLLIIDVMMPKMDGLSATMKIRESKNIPIIILSAKTEESDKILGLYPWEPMIMSANHSAQMNWWQESNHNCEDTCSLVG